MGKQIFYVGWICINWQTENKWKNKMSLKKGKHNVKNKIRKQVWKRLTKKDNKLWFEERNEKHLILMDGFICVNFTLCHEKRQACDGQSFNESILS